MGPVWAYWAFLMECHCGDILRNIRSWRFPYANINKYVTSCAQLTHITLLYGLHDKLSLLPPVCLDNNFSLPSCKSSVMLMSLFAYHSELDPLYILTPPKGPVETLSAPLRMLRRGMSNDWGKKPVDWLGGLSEKWGTIYTVWECAQTICQIYK